jgi:hypothetical protein
MLNYHEAKSFVLWCKRKRESSMARSNNNNKTWETRDSRTPEQKLWMAVLGAAAEDAVSMAELDFTGRWRSDAIVHMDKEYFLNPNRKMKRVLCSK